MGSVNAKRTLFIVPEKLRGQTISIRRNYHAGDLFQFGQFEPTVRRERVFQFAGWRDLRDAFLVMEHVVAEYWRVAAGSAQQLRDVHHVLFVRRYYLRTKRAFLFVVRRVGHWNL